MTRICRPVNTEVNMRKLILATTSVLALGIGGAAVDHAANAGNAVPNAEWNMPLAPGTSQTFADCRKPLERRLPAGAAGASKYGALQRVARRCGGSGD